MITCTQANILQFGRFWTEKSPKIGFQSRHFGKFYSCTVFEDSNIATDKIYLAKLLVTKILDKEKV